MSNSKQILLTTQIKRFVLHRVIKAGIEPEQLMSELELCEKFSVSRVTVRRALEELIQAGYIMRIPKRRGYFSNPELSKSVPFCIGILSSLADYNVYDNVSAQILSGFLSCFDKLNSEISFVTLDPTYPEKASADIENMGLDAFLWIAPDEMWHETIESLLSRQYPLVVIASPFKADYDSPPNNCINFDFASIGVTRANYFIDQGCKNIIYCGLGNKTFQSFKNTLKSAGIEFDDSALIEEPEDLEKQLPPLLKTAAFDGLVSDGPHRRIQTLAEIIKNHPETAGINILADRIPSLNELEKTYKNLKINTLGPKPYQIAGKLAAEHILDLLNKKYTSFLSDLTALYNTKKKNNI